MKIPAAFITVLLIVFASSQAVLAAPAIQLSHTADGGTLTVHVSLSENPGVAAFDFTVKFDSAQLRPLDITKRHEGILENNISLLPPGANEFTAFWIHADGSDTAEDGTFFDITFQMEDQTDTIDLELSADSILNEDLETVPFHAAAKLTIPASRITQPPSDLPDVSQPSLAPIPGEEATERPADKPVEQPIGGAADPTDTHSDAKMTQAPSQGSSSSGSAADASGSGQAPAQTQNALPGSSQSQPQGQSLPKEPEQGQPTTAEQNRQAASEENRQTESEQSNPTLPEQNQQAAPEQDRPATSEQNSRNEPNQHQQAASEQVRPPALTSPVYPEIDPETGAVVYTFKNIGNQTGYTLTQYKIIVKYPETLELLDVEDSSLDGLMTLTSSSGLLQWYAPSAPPGFAENAAVSLRFAASADTPELFCVISAKHLRAFASDELGLGTNATNGAANGETVQYTGRERQTGNAGAASRLETSEALPSAGTESGARNYTVPWYSILLLILGLVLLLYKPIRKLCKRIAE